MTKGKDDNVNSNGLTRDHNHLHDHHGDDDERGMVAMLRSLVHAHHHDHQPRVDRALEASAEGIRAVKMSLLGLAVTAVLQLAVVAMSGSVALLSDTLHNLGDALTALPLWLAFSLGRRPRNERYTYGYGRLEDVAGIFVVVVILASAMIAGYESVDRLLNPRPVHNLGLVIAAAVVGFLGNELVAIYRIRVGRNIGSAALVADGLHARTDGLTSLAVLFGAAGVAAGWQLADPIVGLFILLAISLVLKDATRDIYHRLMDAVDPDLVDQIRRGLESVPGVEAVDDVRVRWIGHELRAEIQIAVDRSLDVGAGHSVAVDAHHALLHSVHRLTSANVHVHPFSEAWGEHHASITHHFPDQPAERQNR